MRNIVCMMVMWLMLAGGASAQEGPGDLPGGAGEAAANVSPLGVRQEHVRQMVQEMEDRFVKLAKALEPTEPEHARRIMETLKAGKQALIEPRMAKVTALLNGGQLEQAEQEQQKLVAEVDKLIDLLTSTSDARQREIERLEQFYKEIARLIGEQQDLRKQTDISQDRDRALRTIDQQIAALKELIGAQKDLQKKTDEARKAGAPAVMRMADEQAKLRRQTDALGKQMDQGPGPAGEGSSLGKATEHQQEAEQKMGEGQGVSAGSEQGKAVEEMNKALEKLEGERSRIARLPDDALPRLAEPEDQLAGKTGDLSEQMEAAAGISDGESGQRGEGTPGTPGQPKVAEAGREMKGASGQMQERKGDEAKDHQDKAISALKDAQKQIEERLRQLRQETQEEVLAALEARFREMLSRQKPVTLSTADVEASRMARGAEREARALSRPEKLQVAQLAVEEQVLVEMAAKAMDVIAEDGTTLVLPEIVGQLHEDLQTTAKFLAGEQTGGYTQALQREIEKTLEELIEALQKAQEQQEGQGQSGEQGEQKPQQQPLVPDSAELKLLRAAQLRVNRRTSLFDASRTDVRELPADLAEEVRRLAARQEDVRKMTERLAERK